jgi:membrane protein required for colicin V production
MNWVDLAIPGVLLLSALAGFARGLVREVLGIGAWVLALLVASPWGVFPEVLPVVRRHVADPNIADLATFLVIFLPTLLVLWIVARAISGRVQRSALGGLDRTFGLLFGLARGALIVVAAYIVAGLVIPVERWPQPVLQARLLPLAWQGATWTALQVPPRFRPVVSPLPGAGPLRAADLLHANPVGRALNVRPGRP